MKTVYLFITICITTLLSACSSTPTQQPVDTAVKEIAPQKKIAMLDQQCSKKDPLNIAVYPHEKPKKPYIVVGKETISKYNEGGIKRQEACLRDAMRNLAASIGGDAVIDLQHHNDKITATVIAYDKNELV